MAAQKANIITIEDVRVVQKFLAKNWLLLLLLPLLIAAAAMAYIHRVPEISAAKTDILLKSGEDLDYQSQVYSSLAGFASNYANITNQKRVLTSYDLIAKTLEKLDFHTTFYVVGRMKTIPGNTIETMTVDLKVDDGHMYSQLIDLKVVDSLHYQVTFNDVNDEEVIRIHPFGVQVREPEYRLLIEKREQFDQFPLDEVKAINYRIKQSSLNQLVGQYRQNITVESEDYSSFLTITIQDELASRAKTFLDTLSSVYIDYTLEKQITLNNNTIEYIDLQLNKVSEILDSIETDMEIYKETNAILDLDKESDQYFRELVKYESEQRRGQLSIQALNSLDEYMKRSKDDIISLPPSAYILDDKFLDKTLSELYNRQIARNNALFSSTPDNPVIIREKMVIDSLKRDISIYVVNSRIALQDRVADLGKQIRDYELLVKSIPGSERDVLQIKRRLDVNEKMYTFLLEKRANTVIAKAAIIPQTTVIEKARGLGIVAPDKTRFVVIAAGIGFILAALFAFIRFLFFERVENTRELKQVTQIPIIGGIPYSEIATNDRLVVDANPKSNIAESFRSIRTNVQYMNPDTDVECILITSLHPGEGKTFCSSNLSTIFAKAGKRVALIDFDMHKPKVHEAFGITKDKGLSSYLVGNAPLEECIQRDVIDYLDIIPSGPVPPNPSELVLSKKVNDLIILLKETYDMVIIDTPPILLISDAMALRSHADMGIFVMNTKSTTKQGVRYLEEIIEQNKLENSSILLNNIKTKRWRYYYGNYGYSYGYGYGSGYGYGYTYGEGEK